jgi:hypothetical protein
MRIAFPELTLGAIDCRRFAPDFKATSESGLMTICTLLAQQQNRITNEDLLRMTKAGFEEDTILQAIE